MTIETITTVDTGEKSRYLFRKLMGGGVAIEREARDASGYFPPDAVVDIDSKGATAVRRLAESHAELRRFFDAMQKLAAFDTHGRFLGFIDGDYGDLEDDERDAWETVGEIFESIADFEGLEL